MSDPSQPGNESALAPERVARRWQVGLRTTFLLVAAIAVWLTFFINRAHNARLDARIKAMGSMAHELVIVDKEKIAVVKREEYWYDENRWDLYLPPGEYRLAVATRKIDNNGLAPPGKSATLKAGRHRISLKQEAAEGGWRVSVGCDGSDALAVQEPKSWDPNRSSTGGGQYSIGEQLSPDEPVVLFRRRFSRSDSKGTWSTPTEPCDGILLWIESVAARKGRP